MAEFGPGVAGKGRIDDVTGSFQVVDFAHHEIHEGDHYLVEDYTTLADGGTIQFSIETPDSPKWAHLLFNIVSSGPLTIDVYEGGTVTGGTAVTPVNNNRNSAETSGLTIKANPTWSGGSKLIGQQFGSAGAGPFNDSGGNGGRENELVLKQNESYLWRFVSGADGNIISYLGEWYEHTNL